MLAISFLFPGVLAALAALAGPVLLHLLMRSRPKRMALPTVEFLRVSYQQNRFRLRISRWLLLAARMALLASAVVLIAWPTIPARAVHVTRPGPMALAIVVDTSASMGAMRGPQSASRIGRDQAAEIIRRLAPGSRVAVLGSDEPFGREGLLAGTDGPIRLLAKASPGYRDTPLAPAIAQARRLLAGADLDERAILVVTDLTDRAWRSTVPERSSAAMTVLDCGSAGLANAGLFLQGPGRVALAPGQPLHLPLGLTSTSGSTELALSAWVDDQAVISRSVRLAEGQRAESLDLGPQRPGLLRVGVGIDLDDALAADNRRYLAATACSAPRVLLASTPAGPDDRTAFILASVIAPPRPGRGALARLRQITPPHLNEELLAETDILVLGSAGGLDEPQWRAVEQFVRNGGGLWIVPGPMTAAAGYASDPARRVLPAGLVAQRVLASPTGLAEPTATATMLGNLGQVPLEDVVLTRRLAIDAPGSDATVPLRCKDSSAAVVLARRGRGRVVLWTICPARAWSNLARQAGVLVVLAGQTLEWLTPPGPVALAARCGQAVALLPADHPAGQGVTVCRVGDIHRQRIEAEPGQAVLLRADEPGFYELDFDDGRRGILAANVPPGESDLTRLSPAELGQRLGSQDVKLIRSADEFAPSAGRAGRIDLAGWVLLALVVLSIGEALLAGRSVR